MTAKVGGIVPINYLSKTWCRKGLAVKKSKINGRGVFTTKPIKTGTTIMIFGAVIFILGAASALGLFFIKNHSVPKAIISIDKKEPNFKPTQFSLDQAPSESIRGTITQMDGEIWRQSRTATEPAKLIEPIIVQQGETLIASDEGKLTIEFNPGATVILFPNSKLEIIQTLPLNLVFNQTKGIGQYQVSGTNPITVRSFNLIVNIDNGLINIDTDEETGAIILGLKTGQATVAYNSPEFESRVWELEPGDVFEYDSNERQGYFNAP